MINGYLLIDLDNQDTGTTAFSLHGWKDAPLQEARQRAVFKSLCQTYPDTYGLAYQQVLRTTRINKSTSINFPEYLPIITEIDLYRLRKWHNTEQQPHILKIRIRENHVVWHEVYKNINGTPLRVPIDPSITWESGVIPPNNGKPLTIQIIDQRKTSFHLIEKHQFLEKVQSVWAGFPRLQSWEG